MPIQLKGANAILTGGSQGLGVVIARALARAGVNLALAARSADKLEGAAREVAAYGVKAAPIAADLTQPADRERLLREAEAALGPIDLLINNAGLESGRRFVGKPPDELERIVHTNVIGPMLLTRAVLPGMIERRRGHIVNLSSIASKLGYPFAATYGGTKAFIVSWTLGLRMELDGTGVSASIVTPGYVVETGMFASHNIRPNLLLGATTPEAVARGVLQALRRDAVEVIVNPRPFWTFQVLYALMPNLMPRLVKALGVIDFTRRTHEGA